MKPDIIVTWPKNCDYPLWRQFIRDNREKFNQIIIGIHETNSGHDYSDFVRNFTCEDETTFFNVPQPLAGEDWRNLSVNEALKLSTSSWVWFTEQDFYPGEGFWDEVNKFVEEGKDAIMVYEGVRIHPCCLFVKREVVEKTHRDFSILPNAGDHFCIFTKDLLDLGISTGVIDPKYYLHYNGLSQNWYLASIHQTPNYRSDEFVKWLNLSLNVIVPVSTYFKDVADAVIMRLASNTTSPPLKSE